METTNLGESYDLAAIDWSEVAARLDRGIDQEPGSVGPDRHTCWLTTVNDDGSPHVTAVGAWWSGEAFWFQCGEQSRKGRNLARDPRCVMSVATHEFDVVVEGAAALVEDADALRAFVASAVEDGWPARLDESGTRITADYNAPSAGPPPWAVYRLQPRSATALKTVDPGGATRWRF